MSVTKDDEDFWNESDKNYFCFENNDKESGLGVSNSDSLLVQVDISSSNTTNNYLWENKTQWKSLKPLHAIIPEKTLNSILHIGKPHKTSSETFSENPEATVKKMLLGHPYSLESFKSLASKTRLMDLSIATRNGNVILGVIIFLTKTLKKTLVQSILMKRPEATDIYIHYLSKKVLTNEITDILKVQERMQDAAMKNLHIIIKNTNNSEKLLQKLQICYDTLFVDLVDCRESAYLNSYIKLLKWQLENKDTVFTKQFTPNCSLLECLSHVCRDYWNSPEKKLCSPQWLLKNFQISARQYTAVAIATRASVQEWQDIDDLLYTKNWRGIEKFQSHLEIEDILKILQENEAPTPVLEKYVKNVDNIKKRLELAMQLKCHNTVIEILTSQGDAAALQNYKNRFKKEAL